MKFVNLIADFMYESQALYGVPDPEPISDKNVGIIVAISTIVIGVVAGIIVLVKRTIKKKNDNVQTSEVTRPPERLYGCPRPDEKEKN